MDGLSFKKLLTGESNTVDRDALYWHYPHGVFQGVVRTNGYKLVYAYKSGQSELFDLAEDPGEQHDLSAKDPERLAEMKQMLRMWLAETGVRFPDEGFIMP